jgi:hypothetical protein
MFVLPTFGLGVIASPLSVLDSSLTFPTIQVFDNESDFIDQTDAPNYTIVLAKDTNRIQVWNGTAWVGFDKDSIV